MRFTEVSPGCVCREVKTYGGFFCVNARDTKARGAKPTNYSNPTGTPGRVSDILAGLRSPGPNRTPGSVFRSPQLGAAGQTQVRCPAVSIRA